MRIIRGSITVILGGLVCSSRDLEEAKIMKGIGLEIIRHASGGARLFRFQINHRRKQTLFHWLRVQGRL